MWLPKDERTLLKYYYSKLGDKYNGYLNLDKEVLIASMKILNSYPEHDGDMRVEPEIMKSPAYVKVSDTHRHLEDRGLLNLAISGKKRNLPSGRNVIDRILRVSSTTEGYDLARKYNHWFTRWGLWWHEHKVNPIWLIIGFVITVVVSYISGKLTN